MSFVTPDQLLHQAFEHHRTGRLREAEETYHQVLALDANNVRALQLLGILAQQANRHDIALQYLRESIALDPSQPEAFYNLGNSLLNTKQFDAAADAFATAMKLSPTFFEAIRNLGSAQMLADRADAAMEAFARAAALQPTAADVHNNLGLAQSAMGAVDQAIESFRRAKELSPSYRAAQDNYLYTLLFHAGYDAEQIAREHRAWAEGFPPLGEVQFANERTLDRPLRVGYISPNFREHPVGRAMLPLIEQADRDQFMTTCYSDSIANANDPIQQRLRRFATTWRESAGWSDEQLMQQIRADQIDILVDTTLHMTGNRLPLFARRAAPVQVTFIGYPATTGLSQIDYRITDPWLDPPGASESVNSETLLRLSRSFWCYDGQGDPLPSAPAARGDGPITFGSLNNPAKISPGTIETWSKILAAVPSSRLMLQGPARAVAGIDPTRLIFVPRASRERYLANYQQIDIGLDPWPYNGHMTSCDALWMGVPVVSLEGRTSVGRGGASILAAIGLTELLARTTDQYVEIVANLACDRERLSALRATLRARMKQSPLMDSAGFTRDVEKLYREMWTRWLNSAG